MKIREVATALTCVALHIEEENTEVCEFLFDSRKLTMPTQTIFFAIQTVKDDGHKYIEELYKRGVRNFVITHDIEKFSTYHANFFQVNDAIKALQSIAIYHRSQFDFPVVGISGSNGKTIVKEWLTQALTDNYCLVVSPNSYNSQIGVAISVLQFQEKHNFALVEAGISQCGEMEQLASMICPKIGILTNIGDAHSLFFHSNEEKLVEKLKLFVSSEALVYCSDDDLIEDVLQRQEYNHLKKLSWGKRTTASYVILQRRVEGHCTQIWLRGITECLSIPFVDAASVENVMHIVVLMIYLGYSISSINQKIAQFTSISMRMEVKEGVNQSVILNDTYSLDVNSLRIALDFLNHQAQEKQRTLFISDFEQVKLTSEDYLQIAQWINGSKLSKLVLVGKELVRYMPYFDVAKVYTFLTTEELLEQIDNLQIANEVVLVKGARCFSFEKIVEVLQNRCQQTVLQVHLEAIVHNLNYYKSKLKPTTKMVAMVKAMCYGLGDAELVNELSYRHVDYLAVAYTDEGVLLRKRNIRTPIIVLGAEAANFHLMIKYDLEPEIFTIYYLRELERCLSLFPHIRDFPIHLKLDTGMHRIGFCEEEIYEAIAIIKANSQLRLASVFSHLAAADDPTEEQFTRKQIADFTRICTHIESLIQQPFLKHILNSAGIISYPEAQFDMVRLGLGLYGFSANSEAQKYLAHTITLKSLITQIKKVPAGDSIGYNRTFVATNDMVIAVVPLGYADGLPRELSNGVGVMVVNGAKCPIVGKICMDMCMIDVTGLSVQVEDEVIVYGDTNRVDVVAKSIGKTPYELLTSITKRVPRIYIR